MAVHQIVVLAVDDLCRGLAQVRPDLLAVDADAAAVGILHVIHLADNPVLRLGSQFAGVFVLGNVVMLIQCAVRLLVHHLIKASVFNTAGIVLVREAGGHRLHLHISKLQPIAVHAEGFGSIHLRGGFVLVVIEPCIDKFGEAEHIHTVVLSVGGIGHAIHLDAAFHCPFHRGHPVNAGKCLIQARRLTAEVLARSHGVAKARDIHQPHSSAVNGHGVVAVPNNFIAGAQEIRHREGVTGSVPQHLTQVGTAAPLMGVSCHRIKLRLIIGHAVVQGIGHRMTIVDLEVLSVEAVPVHLVHILNLGAAASEGVEAQAVGALVVQQEVIISGGRSAGDSVHSRLQAAEVVVVDLRRTQRQDHPHIHFLQRVLIGEVFALVAGHGSSGDQADAGLPAAAQQALGSKPAGADGLQQDLVGGILCHGQVAGGKINGNTFVQLDLHHLAGSVLDEFKVTNRCFCAALFNPGDIAPGVHVEQGAVGQQIAVKPFGCIVALEVVLQHILAGKGIGRGKLHSGIGDVTQRTGQRDGDGGSTDNHRSLHSFLQVHLHIAAERDHPLNVHRVFVALQNLVILVHKDQGHRYDIHEHVAIGLDVHHTVAAGEYISVESLIGRAYAGSTFDQQVMGPYRRYGGAGRNVGHAVNARECSTLFTGPDKLHMAIGVGYKSADLYTAGAAELGPHFGFVINHIFDGVADAKHVGLNESAVGDIDAVQLHVKVGTVCQDHPGQHRLVVDENAADGIMTVMGEVRHAGQVVADVAEGDNVAVLFIEFVGVFHTNFPHRQLSVVFGNINVDAACGIAQIKDGVTADRNGSSAGKAVAGNSFLDDKSAFAGIPPDPALVEAIAGNRYHRTSQGDAGAQYGVGRRIGCAASLGQSLTHCVQLDDGMHTDVGIPVGRLDRSVNVQVVVTGNVGPVNSHIRPQGGFGIAEGVHRRAQSRALGVGVSVDIHFAVAGDDLHIFSFDDHQLTTGFSDDHIDIQVCVHIGRGIGRHTQTGGIRTHIGCHPCLRRIGADVHLAEAGPNQDVLADLNRHPIIDVHQSGSSAQGHHAAGRHLRAGENAVPGAAFCADNQVAVVGKQGTVLLNQDRNHAVQGILGPQHGSLEESSAVGIGSCVQLGRGNRLHDESLTGIQDTIDTDGVGGVGSIFAVGHIGVHTDTDTGAPGLAAALGGIFAKYAHISFGGAHLGTLQHLHAGVVPGVGGQHTHSQIAGSHIQASFDIGPGIAGVVSPQGDVPDGLDDAVSDDDAHSLRIRLGATHLCVRGVDTAGHQATAAFAGSHSIRNGITHRFCGEGSRCVDQNTIYQHIHLVVGGGGSIQTAQQYQSHVDIGLGNSLCLGQALGPHADVACTQCTLALQECRVGGTALGGDMVDTCTYQAHVCAAGTTGLGRGDAVSAGANDLGVHVHGAAYLSLPIKLCSGSLTGLQHCIHYSDGNAHAGNVHLAGAPQRIGQQIAYVLDIHGIGHTGIAAYLHRGIGIGVGFGSSPICICGYQGDPHAAGRTGGSV